jgi:hypothetical protein
VSVAVELASAEAPSVVWLWAVSWASPYCQTAAWAAGWKLAIWNCPVSVLVLL